MATSKQYYEISTRLHWVLRTLALLIDFILVNIVTAVLYFAVGQPLLSAFLYTALAALFYGICVEAFAKRISLGLLLTNLRVISLDPKKSFLRKCYRFVGMLLDFLPFIQWITIPSNIAIAYFNPRSILCDRMGKTAVVYRFSILAEAGA